MPQDKRDAVCAVYGYNGKAFGVHVVGTG